MLRERPRLGAIATRPRTRSGARSLSTSAHRTPEQRATRNADSVRWRPGRAIASAALSSSLYAAARADGRSRRCRADRR